MSRGSAIPVELPLTRAPSTRAIHATLVLAAVAAVTARWPVLGLVLVPWTFRVCAHMSAPSADWLRWRTTGGWELLGGDGSRRPVELLGPPFVSRWLVAVTLRASPAALVSWRHEQPDRHSRLLQRLRAGREPA